MRTQWGGPLSVGTSQEDVWKLKNMSMKKMPSVNR